MDKPSSKRLFVAIPLPPSTNRALDKYCQQISIQHPLLKLRFTPTTKRHLTLAFLGSLNTAKIQNAVTIVETLKHPVFTIELESISRFPEQQSRIIVALPKDSDMLSSLHNKLHTRLNESGLPTQNRQFRPHISLTRIKKIDMDLPLMLNPPIEMKVSEIILYESLLTDTGSIYTPIQRHHLP